MRLRALATVASLASLALPAAAHGDTALVVTTGNQLLSFDTSSPGTITAQLAITGIAAGETVQGLDYRPASGQLYAFAVPTAAAIDTVRTYTLDPATGVATPVGASTGSAIAEVPAGYGFDPVLDRLRRVDTSDRNLRIRPADGTLAPLSDASLAAANMPDVVALAFDRSFPGSTLSTAFAIDRTGSRLDRIGGVDGYPSASSGVVTPVGALGVTVKSTADAGFDVSADGRAFAALTAEADSLTRLYGVDLATGAATAIGPLGAGDRLVSSLAVVPGTEKLAPGPPAAPTPAPQAPADATRPAGLIDVTPLGLRTLLASRAAVPYWVSEACKVSGELRAGGRLVASGSASRGGAGAAKLRLKATAAGRRALARTRRVTGSLRLTLTDAAGNRSVITRALALRR